MPPLQQDLIAYWPMYSSEGLGTDVHSDNDLTAFNLTGRTGKIVDAASFNGSSSYFQRASEADLQISGAFAIQFWIWLDDISGTQTLVSKWANGGGNQQEWILFMSGGTLTVLLTTSDNVTTTFSAGQWYHVILTGDDSANTKLYINGSLVDSGTGSSYRSVGTSALRIGQNTGTNFFDGGICEFAFWQREILADEVSDLYNENNGLPYPLITSTYAISGTVTLEGSPVQNATVRCIRQSDNVAIDDVVTDSTGEYLFDNLNSEELYHVAVEYEQDSVLYNALSLWNIAPYELE
jgi:hypothetical protein